MFRMLRVFMFLFVLWLVGGNAFCQAPSSPVTPAEEVRAQSLLKQLSLDEKIDLIGGLDAFYIRPVAHIGLPKLKMSDGPFGIRNFGPATTFGGIGLAATWDRDLVKRFGTVVGRDARARGVHFLLGPGVNIYRAPMAGRNFEYYGEDPFLVSQTAAAYIEGVQSQDVCATIKHFMGNNQEYDRRGIDSVIDQRTMREIYLPAFEVAVKQAHVCAIMDSYNFTNGVHMSENGALNSDLLKKEWGFPGIVMSDWDSTYNGIASANGGLDLEMPSGKFMNRATLLPAIAQGKVSEATIDDKVLRILRMAVHFGWLDRPQTDTSIPLFSVQSQEVAREAARSGMVLLKNEGSLLPFEGSQIHSLAVIGPNAYPARVVGGGSAAAQPYVAVSFLQGIADRAARAGTAVFYDRGIPDFAEMAEATEFITAPEKGGPGLNAELFNNPDLRGASAVRTVQQHINFDRTLGDGTNANDVSARWTGYFVPKSAGKHVVFVQGTGENCGYRLYIDDKLIFDDWSRATETVGQAEIPLSAGPHKVRFEYSVHWSWGGPVVRLGIVRPEEMVRSNALQMASHADAVVLAVGFDQWSESEASDRTFQLPPAQGELIRAVAAANPHAVVVITSGGAVDMNPWVRAVPAVLQAWYAGEEGGAALAQLLFGDYSPSGKLPITFERRWQDNAVHDSYYPAPGQKRVEYKEGVFVGYRHFEGSNVKPLFPFGYGLSYTSFAYKNLEITPFTGDRPVIVSFDITNTGRRNGAEIAEVYVGESNPRVARPVRELKGFGKVDLRPGETKHLSVELDRRAFSYYDAQQHRWTADPGSYTISVGRSSADIELQDQLELR